MELAQINKDDRQVIHDKKNDFVKIIFTPIKDQETKFNMHDPNIWRGFPLSERIWYNLCCRNPFSSRTYKNLFPIDWMLANPCRIDNKINLVNHCASLIILKSGTLDMEPRIIHPFVKVSIINLKTCKYLQKKYFDAPAFLLKEKYLKINHNRTQNILEFNESSLDFIPPFSTAPYDLRAKGESFAEWNEEFVINDEAMNIFDSNNLMFFELQDFNLYSKNENDFIHRIAWGYLKLVGFSQTYLGKYKIQLYKYKYKPTEGMKHLRKTNQDVLRTPDVLYEFNWIKKEKYQTFIQIELRAELKPRMEDIDLIMSQKRYKTSVFNLEGEDIDKELLKAKVEREKKLKFEELDHIAHLKRLTLLKRKRGTNEDCYLPDKLLYKFSTAKLGCLTHEFSNDGKYLAAACTDINSITTIKIFNIEEGNLKYHFKGNQQLIHSLTWSPDDLILITSSSDNTVSLWNIPSEESNDPENLEFMDNERNFKLLTIPHPSYVYSVAIYPELSKENLVIASACFDGIVRIFSINFLFDRVKKKYNYMNHVLIYQIFIFEELQNKDVKSNTENDSDINFFKRIKNNDEKQLLLEKTVLDHRHPNSLIFDDFGRLIIGDSQGSIHIWEVNLVSGKPLINKLKVITHKEIEGDNINKIMIEPSDKRRLIIHSRDNCIRLLDISKDKPKVIVRYFGLKCNKTNIKSCLSPDGQYILAGSEEGQPYLWSLDSGIPLSTDQFECKFLDILSDVSWNKEYNIVALSGFGQEHPLLVYVYEKNDISLDPSNLKIKKKNILPDSKEEYIKSEDNLDRRTEEI